MPTKTCSRPHTPSIAFRHLPPNSARFGYATEGALFNTAHLSTDVVSALRKVRVLCLIRLWKQPTPKQARKHDTHPPPRVKKRKLHLDSTDCGFICACVNFVGGYKWHTLFYLSCLSQTYYCLCTNNNNNKLLVSWQLLGTFDVTKYSSGWRKDVVNQCLEFGPVPPSPTPPPPCPPRQKMATQEAGQLSSHIIRWSSSAEKNRCRNCNPTERNAEEAEFG